MAINPMMTMNGQGMTMPPPQGQPPMMGGQPPMQPQAIPQQLGPMNQGMEEGEQQDEQSGDDSANPLSGMDNYFDFALSEANLAKKLRDKKDKDGDDMLDKIGNAVYQGFMDDSESRQPWMEANEEWLKLALLIRENKSYPWPKASNVKYPLIATAAMQFSARAYPTLVPQDGNIVKARVISLDSDGSLSKAATRVARHMSYQVMCELPNWEEEMDKLLMTMAVSGICFKKTYHNSQLNKHCSHIVYPENLVINYHAKSLEMAFRKTEILKYTKNEYREKVLNDEEFLEWDLGTPIQTTEESKKPLATNVHPGKVDESTPYTFLACHTFWDLDEDGYDEPYIITIHKESKKVVRIIARWDSDGVMKNDKGKISKIVPVEYFTDFPFIPNPDGSIYACGFGMLLGPLNESVNTLINQLVDAGTLANLPSGFIGRNLRIKMGQVSIRPGEWKVVNASGEEMSKSFYPLPIKEPSQVLYELLNMLVQSGNQLASIAEIFVGKMPGQNTPATTTQETIQQGMAVFTAIYKRVYRSLQKEFKKIFRLNRITPGILEEEVETTGDQTIQQSDYSEDTEHLIIPGGDPTGDSSTVRIMKLQQVGALMETGVINTMVFAQRMLEANEIPNYQELLQQPPPPPPDPKVQTEQMKQQTMQMKASSDAQAKQQDMENKKQIAVLEAQIKAMEMKFKEQELALKLQGDHAKMQMDQVAQANDMQMQQQKAQMETAIAAKQAESELQTTQALNAQSIRHGEEAHQQKMTQAKQTAAQKKKESASNGTKGK